MKKIIALILAVLTLFTLIGCNNTTPSQTSGTTAPTATTPDATGKNTWASDELLELSFFVPSGDTGVNAAMTMDMPVMKALEEATNIRFAFQTGTPAECNEKFPVMMADPSSITDIVRTSPSNGAKFGKAGAFIALEDYLPNYPNLKKLFLDNEDVRRAITDPEGHIYCLPALPAHIVGKVWYVRQDWLDKLDLEVPTTIEEAEAVLMAFKGADLNNNGEDDEIPYFAVAKEDIDAWSWSFGIDTAWYINDDNVPEFGPSNPAYKDYVEMMARFYKNGLIDQEYLTRGGNRRSYCFDNNIGGMVHSQAGACGRYNETAPETTGDPNFKLLGIAPFIGPSGKIEDRTGGAVIGGNGLCVSLNNKHVDETLKLFDYLYSDEGKILLNFGIEDVTFDWIDGYPTYKKEFTDTEGMNELKKLGVLSNIPKVTDIRYEEQTNFETYNTVKDLYENNGWVTGTFPTLMFTDEEQKIVNKHGQSLKDYVAENTAKWISGQQSLDNFDEYFKNLSSSFGLEELTAAYRSAYARYIAR